MGEVLKLRNVTGFIVGETSNRVILTLSVAKGKNLSLRQHETLRSAQGDMNIKAITSEAKQSQQYLSRLLRHYVPRNDKQYTLYSTFPALGGNRRSRGDSRIARPEKRLTPAN